MKRTLSLALMLLLTALIPAHATRAGTLDKTVLVEGNPPLTQSLIDQLRSFFEFTFETNFTTTQTREFQPIRTAACFAGLTHSPTPDPGVPLAKPRSTPGYMLSPAQQAG